MSALTKAVLVYGGNGKNSRLNGILDQAARFLERASLSVETIYIDEIPAEDLIGVKFNSPAVQRANAAIAESEAVIILTPVYKASFSGILKTYLDLLPQKALKGKRLLPVAIGGSLGHLLSIEYSLKPVLSALGANHILDSVFIEDTQVERLENNEFFIAQTASDRLNKGLEALAGGVLKV